MDPSVISLLTTSASQLGGALGGNAKNNTTVQHDNSSVQDRVHDAQRAGISPLAALGVGSTISNPTSMQAGQYDNLSNVGQDISRAIDAGSTSADKFDTRMRAAQATHADLENQLLRRQIAQLDSPGNSSGVPADFQFVRDQDGTPHLIPSETQARGMEGDFIGNVIWGLRNHIVEPVGHALSDTYGRMMSDAPAPSSFNPYSQ